MATQKKVDTLADYSEKLTKAKAIVIADFQGIKHKQLEELRKLLRKTNAEFTIVKNSLFKRAVNEHKKAISEESLHGATGALFAYEDEVSPVKELMTLFKNVNLGKIKSGLLGDKTITGSEVEKMATLPSKDVLRAQLVGQLKSPLYGLHNALGWNIKKLVWTLEAVKSKKS